MEEKLYLIDEIKSAPLKKLTLKQLKSILKIINEYLGTTVDLTQKQEHEISKRFLEFHDQYKTYVEDTGFVENGIEYEFLHYIEKILKQK